MTRQPAYSYRSEVSERAVNRARRRYQAHPLPPCPSWCDITTVHRHVEVIDEHWGPVKTVAVALIGLALVYALAVTFVSLGEALA